MFLQLAIAHFLNQIWNHVILRSQTSHNWCFSLPFSLRTNTVQSIMHGSNWLNVMTCICNFEDERNKIANFLNLEPISKQSRTLCTASLTFEINTNLPWLGEILEERVLCLKARRILLYLRWLQRNAIIIDGRLNEGARYVWQQQTLITSEG